MNKKILLISSMLLTLILITIVIFNNTNNNESNIISNINKDTQIINSNMITMMYETESGSGEYTETKDTTWPESGYIFNDTLSGCENGGELEYNSQNNTVNLLSNRSDRCYVYFDKYDGVWIDNVSVTNVTGSSVTLDVSAASENGSITTYYYALNDSEEYQESAGNIITINDLNKLTEYKISIYAIDSTNAKSNIYELNVSTTDENGPIIGFALINDITPVSITLTINIDSDVEISKYYYSCDDGINYTESTSNIHVFNGLSSGTNYIIKIFVEDVHGNKSKIYSFDLSTLESTNLADYIKSLAVNENSGIFYHSGALSTGARDESYRYYGGNPNNYICFGTSDEVCPENNIYRIIGVYNNNVKIIKATSIGDYSWNTTMDNHWSTSSIRNVLNDEFYNSISTDWQNIIVENDWQVGGVNYSSSLNAKGYYDAEIGVDSENVIDTAKIGLMYVNEYGFAASSNYWNTSLYYYTSTTDDNWLYSGVNQWTISRYSSGTRYSLNVRSTGDVWGTSRNVTEKDSIRPTFYLSEEVKYLSGSGSIYDPIKIGWN